MGQRRFVAGTFIHLSLGKSFANGYHPLFVPWSPDRVAPPPNPVPVDSVRFPSIPLESGFFSFLFSLFFFFLFSVVLVVERTRPAAVPSAQPRDARRNANLPNPAGQMSRRSSGTFINLSRDRSLRRY